MNSRSKRTPIFKLLPISAVACVVISLTSFDANAVELKTEFLAVADGDTIVVSSEGADLRYDVTEILAAAGSTPDHSVCKPGRSAA